MFPTTTGLSTDVVDYLRQTVRRLARGLWFAYAGELCADVADIPVDDHTNWLQDAADLLLGGQFDHLVNWEGTEALAALRRLPHPESTALLTTAPANPDQPLRIIAQDSYKAGYEAAKRFYGTQTRANLSAIADEVRTFRAAFPPLPAPVEPYIARIEQLASHDDGRLIIDGPTTTF